GTGGALREDWRERDRKERRLQRAMDARSAILELTNERWGSRHDEMLYDESLLKQIWKLHRAMAALDTVQATELLIDRLRHTTSNQEFLKIVDKTLKGDD